MEERKPFVSLGVSLSLLSALLFLLSFFIIIYALMSQQKENDRALLHLYGETVLNNMIQAVELSGGNRQWLQSFVVAAGTSPGLLQVAIMDDNGLFVAHSNPGRKGQAFPGITTLPIGTFTIAGDLNQEPFMRFVAPVALFPERMGEHGLVLIDAALRTTTSGSGARQSVLLFLCLVVLFAFCIIVLALFLNRRVIKIVRELRRGAGRVASGNFSERLTITRNDELGLLAESFNIMAQSLGETTISRNFFDKILTSMGDSLIVLDADLRIIRANPAALALLGYEETELLGKKAHDIIESPMKQTDKNVCELREKAFNQLLYIAKDGHKIPVLTSRAFVEQSADSADSAAIVCIAKDISERMRAEEEIRRTNEELRATNQKLQHTQEQLVHSAKLASLGEMAAGIAHELNQPLHVIGMTAEMGSTYLRMQNHEKLQAGLERIVQQVHRATAIINHLRTFGRDAAGVEKSDHDINRIIEESLILFSEQLRVRGIELRTDLDRQIPLVTCNANHIEQVVANLLVNAKDALKAAPKKMITITSRADENHVIIDIRDTGCGMEQTVREKIFDPFFTTKEIGKGTGLGLSISYGIIKEHGGTIEVQSAPAQGTLFRLILPATTRKP